MTTPTDILQQRRRLAEEQLIGDGQWRDNLTDDQAQRLLVWARDYVAQAILQTAVLPPADAEEALDETLTAVTHLMRQVNDLTADLPGLDEETAVRRWQAFLKAAQTLTGSSADPKETEQLVYLRQTWDNEATFTQLHQLIVSEQEEE